MLLSAQAPARAWSHDRVRAGTRRASALEQLADLHEALGPVGAEAGDLGARGQLAVRERELALRGALLDEVRLDRRAVGPLHAHRLVLGGLAHSELLAVEP